MPAHSAYSTLCPDGNRLLCGTQFLAIPTYEPLGDLETNEPYTDIAFSPDGKVAALSRSECRIVDASTLKLVRTLSEPPRDRFWPPLVDPHFTPDGRCLILRTGHDDDLRFFDTKTWERISRIPEIPLDAIQWEPSKSWQHAVMRTKSGILSLWDAKTKSAQEFDAVAPLLDAAFSPDESQVALITSDKNGYSNPRLRVFQTGTGKLVYELRVGEIGCDRLRLPQWSPDGRYILADTKSKSFFSDESVSLWSTKTGRHRADFVGCIGMGGFLLLPPGDQLIANSSDGTLFIWDFKAATPKISEPRRVAHTHPHSLTRSITTTPTPLPDMTNHSSAINPSPKKATKK